MAVIKDFNGANGETIYTRGCFITEDVTIFVTSGLFTNTDFVTRREFKEMIYIGMIQ